MRKIIAFLFLFSTLSACQTTPQDDLAIAATTAGTLFVAAHAYVELPPCGSAGSSVLCSKPDIMRKIDGASTVLVDAIKAAHENVTPESVNAAQAALAAFQAIIASDEVQKAVKALANKGN